MQKYIINASVHGYKTLAVEDIEAMNKIKDSFISVVISKDIDGCLSTYYKAVDALIRNHNRVALISVEDNNKVLKPIACLMVAYKCYDIYTVTGLDEVTGNFLLAVEEREPNITEVQSFVGGDITAYNDLATFVFGLESLVEGGDTDQLIKYIDENINSIANFTVTVNNMKTKCSMINSDELIDKISELQESNGDLLQQVQDQIAKSETLKSERDKTKTELNSVVKENQKLKTKCDELESNNNGSSGIVRNFNELNTQLIKCKTKFVIYIKEISYVPYVNTLITQLTRILSEVRQLKTKLIIYDSGTNLYSTYNPLAIVSGKDYVANKDTLVNKTNKFVMTEPNQAVIEDILTSEQCFDVVIVYDRLKDQTDIVSGNNVTKFYVINSSKDFNELRSQLKISDTSSIITHANSRIGGTSKDFLDIPTIDNYSNNTESAKTSKYQKLQTTHIGKSLIATILEKSRVATLLSK
jgi:hypothetical protein